MSNTRTIINERTGFEVYLEGIEVPFTSISIREIEGAFPTATLQFPASSAVLRVLPATIVQIFGPDPKSNEKIVLFEGEITTVGYLKNQGTRTVTFNASSLLNQWNSVTARPVDSMVTSQWSSALGEYNVEYRNSTNKETENETPKTNEQVSKQTQEGEEPYSSEVYEFLGDTLKNLKLTSFSDFADEVSGLFEDEKINAGDLYNFINFFIRKFEIYDLFYGLNANSFNLPESIYTSPNVGKIKPFKLKATIENFFKITTRGFKERNASTLILMQAVREFLRVFHYNMVSPSSFTASYQFQANHAEQNAPIRGYFIPNMDNSPPLKNNLVFPHQISSFNYSRDYLKEPTRTIGEVDSILQSGAFEQTKGLKTFTLRPELNLIPDGAKENFIGLTTEETYRGITPNVRNFSPFFVEVENELLRKDAKALTEDKKEEYYAQIKQPLNEITHNAHVQDRLANRGMSFNGVWNPYLMAGLPGAYIETDDGPSVTGTIAAVTHSISASGNAATTFTMRGVRLIYDLRDLNEGDFEQAINDFTLDPYLSINEALFDPKMYSFRNVGQTLYPYLRWGTFSKQNTIFKDYAEQGVAFEDSKDAINKIFDQENVVNTDDSVLDILRNEDGEIVNKILTDLTGETDKNLRNNTAYTRDIYEAIYRYKDIYKGLPDAGRMINKWTNVNTYRALLRKSDYLKSIGVDTTLSISNKSNYKDAINLFTGTKNTKLIKDAIKESQGETTQKIIEGEDRSKILTRAQSVADKVAALRTAVSVAESTLRNNNYKTTLTTLGVDAIEEQKDKWREQAIKALERRKKELEKLKEEEKALNKKLDTTIPPSSEPDFSLEFDNQVFKPYNLTRKTHIEIAFTKNIRAAIKAELRKNPGVGRNNLEIVE